MSAIDSEITEVTRWKTRDGKEFSNIDAAEYHADQIRLSEKANEILSAGGSVADCLRAAGKELSVMPILEKVTKDTKLVISYWQCRDEAGYQVIRFNSDWTVFVHGDAGSWSGPYGNDVPIRELARYAEAKGTLL